MRVLIIGQCFGYAASGYASAHGVEARDLGLARGLARLGWQVDLVATRHGPTDDGLIERIPWAAVEPAQYDAIVLVEITSWRQATQEPTRAAAIAAHRNVVGVLDAVVSEDLRFLRTSGLTTPALTVAHAERFGRPAFVLPWGVPDVPDDLLSPWADERLRVLYLGVMRPRYREALLELARRGLEIWIGALFEDQHGTWTGLTDEARKPLGNLHFLSDLVGRDWHGLHGPIVYGSAWAAACHASVGVNFSITPGQVAINCKIADYLSCGLPVVTEAGPPNAGDLVTLDAGRIVPRGNLDAMEAAIRAEATRPRDRAALRRAARALLGWDVVARVLESHL